MSVIVYDIETGALPWEEISAVYCPPDALPPWDDSMVKYGQTKDPVKRQEKYNEVKAAYTAKLAAEAAEREEHRAQFLADAALSPVTGEILAIGLRSERGVVILGEEEATEADILDAFWALWQKNKARRFVGYCSNFFDLPFIVWRSYKHGIAVPADAWDRTGRYPAYCFVDLIDRLPKRGFNDESRKLGDVCRWLGIGDKPLDCDGATFAKLFRSQDQADRSRATAYLVNDLAMTWQLAERMGVS